MADSRTAKKLTGSLLVIMVLCICLCITTYALIVATVEVKENKFETGYVGINLNGGKAVISEDEFKFEPGMTVTKPFYVKNESSCEVYYRLYFDNVKGGLADVLDVTINNGNDVLCSGKASALVRENVKAFDDKLAVDEERDLTITFHFPEDAGNAAQDQKLEFDMWAEATQTKNNPDRNFD